MGRSVKEGVRGGGYRLNLPGEPMRSIYKFKIFSKIILFNHKTGQYDFKLNSLKFFRLSVIYEPDSRSFSLKFLCEIII